VTAQQYERISGLGRIPVAIRTVKRKDEKKTEKSENEIIQSHSLHRPVNLDTTPNPENQAQKRSVENSNGKKTQREIREKNKKEKKEKRFTNIFRYLSEKISRAKRNWQC
jgi:hypothetical protein